jgi:hypothetical protein
MSMELVRDCPSCELFCTDSDKLGLNSAGPSPGTRLVRAGIRLARNREEGRRHGPALRKSKPQLRSDQARGALLGYDLSMELSFFVAEDALHRLQPSTGARSDGFLEVFDAHRDLIHDVAAKVYAHGPKGSYDLPGVRFLSVGEKRHDGQ